MHFSRSLFFFLFSLGAGFFAAASAQSLGKLTLSADSSTRDFEADLVELSGNVQIIYGDQSLRCERAIVSLRQRTIDAQGEVRYQKLDSTIGAERMIIDYESNTGVIYDGFVRHGSMLFEGNYIIKSSDKDYISENGQFSTCENCPESWSFHGSQVRAELGGYAYLKNSTLRFGGLPVFWLPYLVVPLKSDRQTGLLTPELEVSDFGGLTVTQSLFWALSKSEDMTLTLKHYELRSLMGIGNFRYVLNDSSYGEFTGSLISDRVFADSERLNQFRTPENRGERISRWNLDYKHYHTLPGGYIHRLQLANASDLQYHRDFLPRQEGESALENRMSLSKANEQDLFFVDTSYFVNLMQANPLASNNDAVHKIPEISYARKLSPVGWGGLHYDWNFNYTNFSRTDFSWDDLNAPFNEAGGNDRHIVAEGPSASCTGPEWWNDPQCSIKRDGVFDADRDLIRTGQRADFGTSLTRSYQLGSFLDLTPKLQYRETQYRFQLNEPSSNVRRYLRTEVTFRSTISGVFASSKPTEDGTLFSYKHEVLPELSFTQIPWLSHPEHPFFGSQASNPYIAQRTLSDVDINSPYGLQFDFNDRLYDRKLANFGITNKLIQKRVIKSGMATYRQLLYWRLSQSYDFFQAESSLLRKQPLSELQSELRMDFSPIYIYQIASYFPSLNVADTRSRVRYTTPSSDYVELEHTILHDLSREKITQRNAENVSLILRRRGAYVDVLGKALVNALPSEKSERFSLQSVGYGLQYKLPGDCGNITFTHIRSTDGNNTYTAKFDFAWDGKSSPVMPESILDGVNL